MWRQSFHYSHFYMLLVETIGIILCALTKHLWCLSAQSSQTESTSVALRALNPEIWKRPICLKQCCWNCWVWKFGAILHPFWLLSVQSTITYCRQLIHNCFTSALTSPQLTEDRQSSDRVWQAALLGPTTTFILHSVTFSWSARAARRTSPFHGSQWNDCKKVGKPLCLLLCPSSTCELLLLES